MTDIQIPPTPTVLECADLLEEALLQTLTQLDAVPTLDPYWKFESLREAHMQLLMAHRHVEAVCLAARHDLCLLPSAIVLARAAFEIGIRVAWLLQPADPFQAEARWMGMLAEHASAYRRMADRLAPNGMDTSDLRQRAGALSEYREAIEQRFPHGYQPQKKPPKLDDMLEVLQAGPLYARYIHSSQFVHAGLLGTEAYRRTFDAGARVELIGPRDWAEPLSMCWISIAMPWEIFLVRLGGQAANYTSSDLKARLTAALERLA
jgi:hypothetical protein